MLLIVVHLYHEESRDPDLTIASLVKVITTTPVKVYQVKKQA